MAMTKQSCYDMGRRAGETGHPGSDNPYKADSWQASAWSDGYRAGKAARETADLQAAIQQGKKKQPEKFVFGGLKGHGVTLAEFPQRMPHATREHLRRLNADALGTKDSTRALRLDNKIAALYQRYA